MDSPDPWADFYNEFQQFSQQHTALHVQTFQPSKRSLAYDTLHNQSEKEQPNINEVEDTTVWVLSSVEASDLEEGTHELPQSQLLHRLQLHSHISILVKVGKSDANKIVRVSEEKIRSEIFMRNVYICELARS